MTVRKYRVREGFTYGANDQHKAGSIVELEEGIARFEMDKLELAEIVHNVPQPNPETAFRDDDSPSGLGQAPGDGDTPEDETGIEQPIHKPKSKTSATKK